MVKPSRVALRLLFAVSAWAFAMPGTAQTPAEPNAPAPAHIAYLDGTATLARDGRAEDATLNVPIVAGDQLRTRDGRAEVVFGDGSVLDVDHFTTLDFLSDDLLRLVEGRVRLTIGGRDRVSYRIDTPSGAVRIEEPGEYRVALIGESGGPLDVELITIRGYATLVNDLGDTQVRAGQRAFASASMAPSYAQSFNSAVWDAFDQWAADRRDERTGTTSARYLPDEIRGYSGSFDRHGDWRYEETYGYVWYPRVHVDWRPYYYGRWRHYSPWGWTWIAYDPWGWPTHHYGRWGFQAGAWFWIPSRHWGPAYVYWASAPGYVGWCPLGWNGRPIFSININVGFGHGYGYYDPYRAWTVVPRHKFASHGNVREYAVPRNRIEHAVPRWTLASGAAPVRPDTATRSVTPIYSAGRSYAVRRDGLTPDRAVGGVTSESRRPAPGAESESLASAPRAYRRTSPDQNVPRATPPAASGVLRGPTTSPADAPRSRARYRDLGPGGTGGEGAAAATQYQGRTPSAADDRAPSRSGYAPRGVPDNAPGYAPRGVPRTTDSDQVVSPRRENPYQGQSPNAEPYRRRSPGVSERPSGSDDRPVRRNPESARPSSPPPPSDRPTYSRPSAPPPPRGDRPTYSRPAPSGGGDRPSRAAPRGGSSGGSRPSSPPPQSNGSDGSRRRPG